MSDKGSPPCLWQLARFSPEPVTLVSFNEPTRATFEMFSLLYGSYVFFTIRENKQRFVISLLVSNNKKLRKMAERLSCLPYTCLTGPATDSVTRLLVKKMQQNISDKFLSRFFRIGQESYRYFLAKIHTLHLFFQVYLSTG